MTGLKVAFAISRVQQWLKLYGMLLSNFSYNSHISHLGWTTRLHCFSLYGGVSRVEFGVLVLYKFLHSKVSTIFIPWSLVLLFCLVRKSHFGLYKVSWIFFTILGSWLFISSLVGNIPVTVWVVVTYWNSLDASDYSLLFLKCLGYPCTGSPS